MSTTFGGGRFKFELDQGESHSKHLNQAMQIMPQAVHSCGHSIEVALYTWRRTYTLTNWEIGLHSSIDMLAAAETFKRMNAAVSFVFGCWATNAGGSEVRRQVRKPALTLGHCGPVHTAIIPSAVSTACQWTRQDKSVAHSLYRTLPLKRR